MYVILETFSLAKLFLMSNLILVDKNLRTNVNKLFVRPPSFSNQVGRTEPIFIMKQRDQSWEK